jgi:hypothetical protein
MSLSWCYTLLTHIQLSIQIFLDCVGFEWERWCAVSTLFGAVHNHQKQIKRKNNIECDHDCDREGACSVCLQFVGFCRIMQPSENGNRQTRWLKNNWEQWEQPKRVGGRRERLKIGKRVTESNKSDPKQKRMTKLTKKWLRTTENNLIDQKWERLSKSPTETKLRL